MECQRHGDATAAGSYRLRCQRPVSSLRPTGLAARQDKLAALARSASRSALFQQDYAARIVIPEEKRRTKSSRLFIKYKSVTY